MSTVSTHVLDAALGQPAAGVVVILRGADGAQLGAASTGVDGRARFEVDVPAGHHELLFGTGQWFEEQGRETFFPAVNLSFSVADDEPHYHVALLLSPFAYTTYRGS
ncbi:hydroxyisourate hydrolase [Nocardioides humilatus]|uniref:5-hydroxyisourate hydrolase n=1 Tax=Nocardioides humilatus TaxID=2607660 RepID=A0A5B1LEW9_9ACTN|nr:hydroxyisourate hydrolase [Nocardioides humilatus]KAA1418996.1 hydroxyisourate hydrolase [Nocardioides humilatus]